MSRDDREGDPADGTQTLTRVAGGSTRASSRCDFMLSQAVASWSYSQWNIGVGELDPEYVDSSDCVIDEVLRRHSVR